MIDERKREPGRVFEPFTIGGRFRVVPPHDDIDPDEGLIRLEMAAGAFGSGEHETTAACLELLAGLPAPAGASVLDLGCGTGILAIAALALGAGQATCVDNDPDAMASCRKNARLNRVTDRVVCVTGTLVNASPVEYDLVLANIYGDILLVEAESLVATARPGARLILSGILHEQTFDVRRRFEALGCHTIEIRMLEEFSALLLERGRSVV